MTGQIDPGSYRVLNNPDTARRIGEHIRNGLAEIIVRLLCIAYQAKQYEGAGMVFRLVDDGGSGITCLHYLGHSCAASFVCYRQGLGE